jgi:hypothetical protein
MIFILDTDVLTVCELPDSPEYLRLQSKGAGAGGK